MMVYGIIPARCGSKGILNKNIKLLSGFPLIAYSIVMSKLCPFINKTIVTTDSNDYIDLSIKWGAQALRRPQQLANDKSSDMDYLLHAITELKMLSDDIIVLLRPTTPIRDVIVMQDIWNSFNNEYDSLKTIHALSEPPEKMFKFVNNQSEEIIPYMNISSEEANMPRQQFNKCYHPNGYMDILRVESIIKTQTVYGNKILGYDTGISVEIDTLDDWKYLEYLIKNDKSLYNDIRQHYEPK